MKLRMASTAGVMLLSGAIALTSPQSSCAGQRSNREPEVVSHQPSLAQVAQKLQEKRSQENLKSVPLYTNDNLPTGPGGLSIIGSGSGSAAAQANTVQSAAQPSPEEAQQAAYLRGKLARAQQHLAMHQGELSVLQQQFNQSKMQYYPNPNKTLMQEYSRQNINKLADQINAKKQQISEDQQEIDSLQDQLQRMAVRLGAALAPGPGAAPPAFVPPPGVKPGTEAYLRAQVDAARQQLSTAREEEKLAQNELSLLKLQQLRTLNPNLQSELAAKIIAKQGDVQTSQQAVDKAQQELTELEKKLSAAPKLPGDVTPAKAGAQ